MRNYEKGDRVRVVQLDPRDIGLPVKVGDVGTIGKVVNNDLFLFLIKFDQVLPNDHACVTAGMWRGLGMQIELFTPATLDEAIDAYQQACTGFEAAQLALEKAKAAVQDARLNLRDALDGET